MRVRAYDPNPGDEEFPGEVQQAPILEDVLDADVVSVHVPLTPTTRGIIGADAFAAMRPGAVFVNTARGELVDQGALLDALDGDLFAAALDVTDPEPLPAEHPLLQRDDVIVTPHVATGTVEAKERMFRTALRQVLQVVRGERPDHLVNAEVWERSGVAG
jgi:phosphoglycerate dehydrogenase-like enzyme